MLCIFVKKYTNFYNSVYQKLTLKIMQNRQKGKCFDKLFADVVINLLCIFTYIVYFLTFILYKKPKYV